MFSAFDVLDNSEWRQQCYTIIRLILYNYFFQEKYVWNVRHRPLVFLLILLLVFSVIFALVYTNTNTFYKPEARTLEPLEFQNLMKGDYEPNRFNGTWISGTQSIILSLLCTQYNWVDVNVKSYLYTSIIIVILFIIKMS